MRPYEPLLLFLGAIVVSLLGPWVYYAPVAAVMVAFTAGMLMFGADEEEGDG